VKIGDRGKIFEEYWLYEEKVDPYVPFHLGPHLIRERCCLGATRGIIVGDYVEESESLRDCASQGRATTAIACLFDRTLQGWYRSARKKPTPISTGLLEWFPKQISAKRLKRARSLGASLDLNALRSLFASCDSLPVTVGPIHGDLHATNILVRGPDAIIIDFESRDNFPLVFDAASLEASLLIEGFPSDGPRQVEESLDSLVPLYEHPILGGSLPLANPRDPSYWFRTWVRQIRRYAREWECKEDQYAGALAIALLTKAAKDKDAPEPEASRRAAAYVLAEHVLRTTFGSKASVATDTVKGS
jgi:hypothetical protein